MLLTPEARPALSSGAAATAPATTAGVKKASPTPHASSAGKSGQVSRHGAKRNEYAYSKCSQEQADQHRRSRTRPAGQAAADRRDQAERKEQRQQFDARCQGRAVAHILEVQSQREQQTQSAKVHDAGDRVSCRKTWVAKQREREHRVLSPCLGHDERDAGQHDGDRCRDHDGG